MTEPRSHYAEQRSKARRASMERNLAHLGEPARSVLGGGAS